MSTATHIQEEIMKWVVSKSKKITTLEELSPTTPLIESRIISSLQVMELLLFMEKLKGSRLDIKNLKPGTFKDVQTIVHTFFGEKS